MQSVKPGHVAKPRTIPIAPLDLDTIPIIPETEEPT